MPGYVYVDDIGDCDGYTVLSIDKFEKLVIFEVIALIS